MPWTRKATAPDSFNVGEALAALITGDATWGWLTAWIPLIGQQTVDTTSFCEAGPEPVEPLDVNDFNTGSRNPFVQAAQRILLIKKLTAVGYDRVFSAYCENVVPAAAGCVTLYDEVFPMTHSRSFEEYDTVTTVFFPSWATTLRFTQFLLPNNGQNNAWPNNARALHLIWQNMSQSTTYADQHPVTLPQFQTYISVAPPAGSERVFIQINDNPPGDYGLRVEACGTVPESATDYDPEEQPQPDGVLAPPTKVYTTIADLGRELDNLELKLEWTTSSLMLNARYLPLPGAAIEDPAEVVSDEEIDLVDAVGVIVTVGSIPDGADEDFGTVPRLHRIGRITFGTADGWYPAIDITQSPLAISPLPPYVTRTVLNLHAPATATISRITPPK